MVPTWKLEGTYFESCNCEAACPCVFLTSPPTGECTVLVAWHIGDGQFGDIPLNGLNAAFAGWRKVPDPWKGIVYLDAAASERQRESMAEIFSGKAGGLPVLLTKFFGQLQRIKTARIEYRSEGKNRSVVIANVAEAEIEAVAGHGGSDVTISNTPLSVSDQTVVLAKSKRLSYHDDGHSWELSGKNGFYSPFSYRGP